MFYNAERAKQLISFDDMCYNGASFSDIDFCLEYRNKIWVIGDVKTEGKDVPKGQRYFLERFVNMARDGGRNAIAIIADHHVFDTKETVRLKDCKVREYYTSEVGMWAYPRRPYYVEEMVINYISMFEGGNCNGQVASCLQKTG